MLRKRFFLLLSLVLIGFILFSPVLETQAQAGTAYQMIAAINQLRANHGMAPLEQHPILMAVTQNHSEYQASIGQGTHYGPGGTTPKDRARAAGFGGGATIFLSENWAAGYDLSINRAIYEFWDDPAHMGTMLGTQYKYIGAGVAFDGNYVYYTVNTGAWVGDPPPPNPTYDVTSVPTTTAVPVIASTPNPDGSIIHIVQTGQTLWTIAVVYDVPLEKIRALNGFTENTILYLGDEVIIQPAQTTSTAPTSPPATISQTPSPSPTKTPLPAPTDFPQISLKTPTLSPSTLSSQFSFATSEDSTITVLAVLISAGAVLVMLFRILTKR